MIYDTFGLILLIIIYFFIAFYFGGGITMLFQVIITDAWKRSDKTKYKWWVKTLYLEDTEVNGMLAYDKRHPKWYKALQIFIGLMWPIYIPILIIGFGAYYMLWRLPICICKIIYEDVLKEIYYWWIGDSTNDK